MKAHELSNLFFFGLFFFGGGVAETIKIYVGVTHLLGSHIPLRTVISQPDSYTYVSCIKLLLHSGCARRKDLFYGHRSRPANRLYAKLLLYS